MKVRAILNPRAGLAARRALSVVERGCPSWGAIEVEITQRPGHARDLARKAVEHGAELVLAVGGDGTANEVAEGILGSGAALGLVPVGSGNGLARTLGIPLTPRGALESLEHGVTRWMDVGFVNGRLFLNVSGAGFDAAIGAAFHLHGGQGGRRGIFTYVRIGLAKLSYRAPTLCLEAGEQRFTGAALIVVAVNGRQYGGGAVIAPRARLDDGLLDFVVIEDAPRLEILMAVPRLFLGGIEGFRRYRHFQASTGRVSGAPPFEHHRDGEPEPEGEKIDFRLQPRALKILVPRPVAEDPAGPFSH